MGTARMMTMAVVAIGAGAFLAMSTIPAFAPYQQRKPERSALVAAEPDTGKEPAVADDHPFTPGQATSDGEFSLGLRDGDVVLHLPRWVEDGGELLTFGRRAWRDWVEPGVAAGGEDAGDDRAQRDDDSYAAQPHHRRDWNTYGYERRRDHDWRGDENDSSDDDGYAPGDQAADAGPQDTWSEPQVRRSYSDGTSTGRVAALQRRLADAAASAAERARDAASDVRAAENVDQ